MTEWELNDTQSLLLQCAARLVVDDGMEYAAAKRQATKQMGLTASRIPWPGNARLDEAVREHIALFCPQEQAAELMHLRQTALGWMDRLDRFRPLVGGAVWRGTATRHSDVYLPLFCDDPKSVEWFLLDQRIAYHPGSSRGWRGGEVPALSIRVRCEPLGQWVLVHLLLHDLDDLRGALKPDDRGQPPRGDAQALRARMELAGLADNPPQA